MRLHHMLDMGLWWRRFIFFKAPPLTPLPNLNPLASSRLTPLPLAVLRPHQAPHLLTDLIGSKAARRVSSGGSICLKSSVVFRSVPGGRSDWAEIWMMDQRWEWAIFASQTAWIYQLPSQWAAHRPCPRKMHLHRQHPQLRSQVSVGSLGGWEGRCRAGEREHSSRTSENGRFALSGCLF